MAKAPLPTQGVYAKNWDRFQNDEVFHASQLQHNLTKEWCEYLAYVRTIDTSHKASPKQLERYATLYHFRYDLKQTERGPMKIFPDCHHTTRAIVSMNKEAGQIQESKRRHDYREDLDPEKFDWLLWLSHNWKWFKFHTMVSPKISRSACLGKPRSIHSLMIIGGTPIGGQRPGGRNQDGSGTTKSGNFFFSGFHTHVVATTVRATGGCTHTFSLRGVQTSRARLAQGVCSAHVISQHLTFSLLMFHPPLCCSRTVTSTPRSRLHLPCRTAPDPKAPVQRTSARAARSLATCPIPRTPQNRIEVI